MFDTSLNHFKSVFAHNFFVVPADRNYFLARFARIYGMHEEFWWQSLQAIEKYLKAGLVLNGVSVKDGFRHDIDKLWQQHLVTFGNCAVRSLSKPQRLDDRFWRGRPLERFIARINSMGHPDSRYGLVSYDNSEEDIFMLDQLVFGLRRRTIGLDWVVGADWEDEDLRENYGKTYRDVIELCPHNQIRQTKIPKGDFKVIGANLENAWYNWNFAFSRESEDREKPAPATVAPVIAGFGRSYLYLLWENLQKTTITQPVSEQIEWLLSYIKLGKESEVAIRDKLKQ